MSVKYMPWKLIQCLFDEASARKIDFTMEKRQQGKLIWCQAWNQMQEGEENYLRVQIEIDDEDGMAYVTLLANKAEKVQYLRDRASDQEDVEEIQNYDDTVYKRSDERSRDDYNVRYSVGNKWKIANPGSFSVWAKEIFDLVSVYQKKLSVILHG